MAKARHAKFTTSGAAVMSSVVDEKVVIDS